MQLENEPEARVLVVDDDSANAVVLLEMLLAEGMSATAATSGAAALELLAQNEFDVVLLDIHMPNMDGAQVLQLLKMRPGPNRNAPVVAVTADTYSRSYEDYLALGFFEMITKPVTVDKLAGCVRRALLMKRRGALAKLAQQRPGRRLHLVPTSGPPQAD